MNDVKTWADIDASPLLQLPPEQRKKLHDGKAGGRGRTCPLPLVQHGVQLSLQRYGGDISL